MERKRTWSTSDEEEDRDRRASLRNRVKYNPEYNDYDDDYDDNDDDDDDDDDVEVIEEGEEDNEQPGLLIVTCGNKTGTLDAEKLSSGEKCIRCEGRWFVPSAFENYAGRGSSKKWKTSILHKNRPLQFWFEQGSLTTKGFKKRGAEIRKQKKILSSNHTSESSSEESEVRSAEETEEDDVEDEDWLPGSEGLVLETEEERVEVENEGEVVDSGVDRSKEEEDKMEKGEMEDEDMPAVDDNDSSVCEEREAQLIILSTKKSALQRKVKVVVKRLPEAKTGCQSNYMERPLQDSLREPLDEDAPNNEDREHNGSGDTAPTLTDPSQMSDPPVTGSADDIEVEFTQSNERKEDGQSDIKSETGNYSTCNHTVSSIPVLLVPMTGFVGDMKDEEREETGYFGEEKERREMESDMQGQWIEGREECQTSNNKHLSMSRPEASGQPIAARVATSPPIGIKEEIIQAMWGDLPTESQSALDECNTDSTNSSPDAAQFQVMKLEMRFPQTTQASDINQPSDMVEAEPSRPSTSCDPDTMDLDQLRRVKLKMQIKVLKLQEEYYTQKIQEKKEMK